MAFIQWLHRGMAPREAVGGKGASLAALIGAGFSVPAGFAVTIDGYRRFAEVAGLAAADKNLEPSDAAAAIGGRIASTPLPDDLRREIGAAYDELAAMAGLACAVRSSALSEDGAAAASAGLYESYLNVVGVADVVAAVRLCYASLWAERTLVYRAARRQSEEDAMAVIVMGLVPCLTAGVAFTAHPVTGARDQVLINASWGLGEAIVSGRVTPDSFLVEKGSFALIEREIYTKTMAVTPHPDGGGTLEIELPAAKATAPSLSDDEARAVARVATAVEAHYGSPQDVEWGLAGGQIHVLQARPITTLT